MPTNLAVYGVLGWWWGVACAQTSVLLRNAIKYIWFTHKLWSESEGKEISRDVKDSNDEVTPCNFGG